MKYIIVDLEATCWEGQSTNKNEIIEIGAVLINEEQEIIDEFQEFVKPIAHPELSSFCIELTSISQNEVNEAKLFPQVLSKFLNWIGNDYFLCSWGFYDKIQFKNDCRLHHLSEDWANQHISLKHQHRTINNLKRALGMKRALKHEGITLEGIHHRGIDDARNITKIFLKYFDYWNYNE